MAAAALTLVEDGTLDLGSPVDDLLPELADRRVLTSIGADLDDTVAADRPITLEDLLAFRLGFGCIMAPPNTYPIQIAEAELQLNSIGPPWPPTPWTPDEWIDRLGTLPLMHQPGERWMYNTGSQVLGILVERAAARLFLGDGGGWGFGLQVPAAGGAAGRIPGGFGWDGGSGTTWRSDVDRGITGILLTQRAMTSPEPPEVFDDFWTCAYGAIARTS